MELVAKAHSENKLQASYSKTEQNCVEAPKWLYCEPKIGLLLVGFALRPI